MSNITIGLTLLVVMYLTQGCSARWVDRLGYVLVGLNFLVGGASIATDLLIKS